MKHQTILTAGKITLAAGLLISASTAMAGIANTKHNLGTGGGGPNTYSGTAEICVFCHTPHGADTSASVPLWNKTLGTPNTYTTYDSLGTSSLDGATAPVGSVSLACLSCHDGTQAMDSVLNAPGSGSTVASYTAGTWTGNANPQGVANLTKDLSNDHPIGIQYGGGGQTSASPAAATNDPDFKATSNDTINGTTVWWVETNASGSRDKGDMQLYTRSDTTSAAGPGSTSVAIAGGAQPYVECASCHDPHVENIAGSNPTFLRIANTGSAVCLACHNK